MIYRECDKTARCLQEINKYMTNNNSTPKNIIAFNKFMDNNVECLYRKINPKKKPVKRDTDFIGFIYFYAMSCMSGKEKNVSSHTADISKFFNDADDFTKHINKTTPHREIINYSNIKATTDPKQWEKKGEYLYNYMHAKFPQDF